VVLGDTHPGVFRGIVSLWGLSKGGVEGDELAM